LCRYSPGEPLQQVPLLLFRQPEYPPVSLRRGFGIQRTNADEKDQIDLENAVAWIPDSKTPNGIAEAPLTDLALEAWAKRRPRACFASSYESRDRGRGCFRRREFDRLPEEPKTVWRLTLRRAKAPYFRIYDLRSTYATCLSASGVADEWVTQLLRQAMRRCSRSTPDEAPNEARGSEEAEPESQRGATGFGHGEAN